MPEIIHSSPDADAEFELSNGKENSFKLNDEICELLQPDSKSNNLEGF